MRLQRGVIQKMPRGITERNTGAAEAVTRSGRAELDSERPSPGPTFARCAPQRAISGCLPVACTPLRERPRSDVGYGTGSVSRLVARPGSHDAGNGTVGLHSVTAHAPGHDVGVAPRTRWRSGFICCSCAPQ